jgi:hypothetical protein
MDECIYSDVRTPTITSSHVLEARGSTAGTAPMRDEESTFSI